MKSITHKIKFNVLQFNRINLSETKKEVSEFIACKCEHVNRRTKVLKLAVLGKFIINYVYMLVYTHVVPCVDRTDIRSWVQNTIRQYYTILLPFVLNHLNQGHNSYQILS